MNKTKEELLESFISRSKARFGDQFDYSKVISINKNTPIILICKEHGEFITTPRRHLYSKHGGCQQCHVQTHIKERSFTTEEFITKAKEVWGDLYAYEKTEYINSNHKVTITCPIHGDFKTNPSDFLRHHGCPKCAYNKTSCRNKTLKTSNLEEFKEKGEQLYPNMFGYENVIYVNSRIEVLMYSKLCNEYFYVTPSRFLTGRFKNKYKGISLDGAWNKETLTTEGFIQKSKFIHGDYYDYSKTEYINSNTPVIIKCPEHGYFTVMPFDHITHHQGCPVCASSNGEKFILNILQAQEYQFIPQYKIEINGKKRYIDFCVVFPHTTVFIEYNGKQHYQPIEYFGGEESFLKQKKRDEEVTIYCQEHNIPLLTYKYDIAFIELRNQIINDLKKLS